MKAKVVVIPGLEPAPAEWMDEVYRNHVGVTVQHFYKPGESTEIFYPWTCVQRLGRRR